MCRFFIYISNISNYLNNIEDSLKYLIISHYSSMLRNLQTLLVIIKNNYKFFLQQTLLPYRRKFKNLPLFSLVLASIIRNFRPYLKLYLFNLQNKTQCLKYLEEDVLFLKVIFPFLQRYGT